MPRRRTAPSIEGRRAGTLGDIGCFSFYPGKNLGACGEGGAVVTDDAELARSSGSCATGARTASTITSVHGFNYRMDGIQGAVLDVKLRYLPEWTERRRRQRRPSTTSVWRTAASACP